MAKGKLEATRSICARWSDASGRTGQITIFIKSATAGGRLTLLDDRDIIVPADASKPSEKPRRLV